MTLVVPSPTRRRLISLAILGVSLGLTACPDPPAKTFKATDITGSQVGGDFELKDHRGTIRRLGDFRGKLVVVFFGFTSCPDVCPTTLLKLGQVMKSLGKEADDVQVVMVTVDPARDTQQTLAQYMASFDPRFIGLIPSEAELKQVAARFKVFISRNKPNEGGFYTVDHSASSFVLDRQGRIRLYVPHDFSSENWAADLRTLLRDGRNA